jgi:hypothetical protein
MLEVMVVGGFEDGLNMILRWMKERGGVKLSF